MATVINTKRVWLGALAGGIVFTVWAGIVESWILGRELYDRAGIFRDDPRYGVFLPVLILSFFVAAYALAWLYARVRAGMGPGPRTALTLGFWVGFIAGFPTNLGLAAWLEAPRLLPLGWMLEVWVGCILAAWVVGWVYQEPSSARSEI